MYRWVHGPSGRTYSNDYNPPKKFGVDDVTNEPLTLREDDRPEVVQRRLDIYAATIEPVLAFYWDRKVLQTFRGTESDVIYKDIRAFLMKNSYEDLKKTLP